MVDTDSQQDGVVAGPMVYLCGHPLVSSLYHDLSLTYNAYL